MKNIQKGFIVPLLITIIAILVIGGGYYIYSQNKKSSIIEQNNANTSTTTVSTVTTSVVNQSNPGVTITSPNGGETFKTGDKINIAWKITDPNANGNSNVSLGIVGVNGTSLSSNDPGIVRVGFSYTDNNYTYTIPNSYVGSYKIKISVVDFPNPNDSKQYNTISAESNLFTITK
jgi:hypothetical protein